MKKKQLAWVLTMAMTAGMLVPYGAAAEETTEAETTEQKQQPEKSRIRLVMIMSVRM